VSKSVLTALTVMQRQT